MVYPFDKQSYTELAASSACCLAGYIGGFSAVLQRRVVAVTEFSEKPQSQLGLFSFSAVSLHRSILNFEVVVVSSVKDAFELLAEGIMLCGHKADGIHRAN